MAAHIEGGAFEAGLSASPEHLEFAEEEDAVAEVSAMVSAKGVLLLGETHGVEENAGVLHWFVRRFGPARLGLEWKPSAVLLLKDFVEGGSIDCSRLQPSSDGRITPQHFTTVRDLVEAGLVIGISGFAPEAFAVPAEDPSQNSWERALADELLAARDSEALMVVVTGSLHASVRPHAVRGPSATPIGRRFAEDPAFKDQDAFYPMGWHVAQAVPTASVRLRYGRGTFTNFGPRAFASDPKIVSNKLYFRDGELTAEVREGTAAAVPGDS